VRRKALIINAYFERYGDCLYVISMGKGEHMYISKLIATVTMLAIPAIASAGPRNPVPEPETLGLLAIGAAALVVARWRGKR